MHHLVEKFKMHSGTVHVETSSQGEQLERDFESQVDRVSNWADSASTYTCWENWGGKSCEY